MVETTGQSDALTAPERCWVCGGDETAVFVKRQSVPVHQNLFLPDPEQARALRRGDLELAVCAGCGFVFNRAFDSTRLDYGTRYESTQMCSASFRSYVDGLADQLLHAKGVRNCRIVEVGCGKKGQFLRKLVEPPEAANSGIGFDPTYLGPESDLDGRLRFRTCFYDEHCDETADVVISRHVIEHVSDPVGLLQTIRRALARSPDPRIFLETPCVEWILRNGVIWDFFYEHCSLFTRESLSLALAAAGLQAREVSHVFGGQYLWAEAGGRGEAPPASLDGRRTAELAADYARREQQLVRDWQDKVARLAAAGPTAIWGAGAKGVTLTNLIDPDGEAVDCLIDLNPSKQGKYVPGTGHPIVAPANIPARGVRNVVVTNPNYRAEIAALLDEAGPDAHLVE